MAKIFIFFCFILATVLVFLGFAAHMKIVQFKGNIVDVIYKEVMEMKENEYTISGTLNQLVIHRVVCSEQSLTNEEVKNCNRIYISEFFSIVINRNLATRKNLKSGLAQCVSLCPSTYDLCRNHNSELKNCGDIEAICLQFCMDHGWKKYTGYTDYGIW